MAYTSSSRGSKNSKTCPVGLIPSRAAAKRTVQAVVALTAAALTAGCGGGGTASANADKLPVALGGPSKTHAAQASGPAYEYRGGRDPVTGAVPPAAAAPVAGAGVAAASPKVIEIRKGDTLHGLSLTHHVSVKALMAANKLTSATIKPGQKLVVPAG